MKFIKIGIILSAIFIFIVACTTENKETTKKTEKKPKATPEKTATPDELASGRKIYKEQCSKCHKDDGTGGKVEIEGKKIDADDLTTEKMKKMPDTKYIKYMVKGIPSEGMPSFKDILSEEEMNEVVKFIRKDIQK